MTGPERLISQELKTEDLEFDASLRPSSLDEFVGQTKLKENLKS